MVMMKEREMVAAVSKVWKGRTMTGPRLRLGEEVDKGLWPSKVVATTEDPGRGGLGRLGFG